MVDAVNPAGVWPPFGAFSMAVIQGDGQVVHLKGQVSLVLSDLAPEGWCGCERFAAIRFLLIWAD